MKFIGVIDSGVGGINVLRSCVEKLNGVSYVYLADNLNSPYGNKSVDTIYHIVKRCVYRLIEEYDVRAVVIACNTATACCIDRLRRAFSIPIIGTEPAVRPAVIKSQRNDEIAILCTRATAKHSKVIKAFGSYGNIHVMPKKHWARLIEDGVQKNIKKFKLHKLSRCRAIVIGCTHYNYIVPYIHDKDVYDNCDGVARRLLSIVGMTDTKGRVVFIDTAGDRAYVDKLKNLL